MAPLKLIFVFLLALCFCWGAKFEGQEFRKDYQLVKELNAYYKEHKDKQTWSDAFWTCSEEGAKLLMPESEKELKNISHLMKKNKYWLAYHDMFSEGNFMTPEGKIDTEVYENWADDEPNNLNNNEDCVVMYNNTKYNDENCNNVNNYICKKDASTVGKRDKNCEPYDPGFKYESKMSQCYKFHNELATWHNAFRICKNEEASLAVINSGREAELYKTMLEKYLDKLKKGDDNKPSIHLGFNDFIKPGTFLTINGQTLTAAGYNKWSASLNDSKAAQPYRLNANDHCGGMVRNGTLHEINCEMKAMFICEHNKTKSSP